MTDDIREQLPSERARIQEEKEAEAKELSQARLDMLREDFGRTFDTDHGQRVLAYLKERCGFGRVILSADRNQAIDPMATTFAAMELNLYLDIRQYIPTRVLQRVEYGSIKPSGTLERGDTKKRQTSKSKSKKKG